MSGPLLLVDSASLYFRAYYALPESLVAPDGRPNNAIRGFLQMLARLVERHGPAQVALCWDEDWRPQWRVDRLPSYKAHRVAETTGAADGPEEVPDTLAPQADALADLLDALGMERPRAAGFEADDLIGTLAARHPGDVVVASGDRDMVQLVSERVRLHLATNGGMERWPLLDPAGVVERYGVTPRKYVGLAVLRGDPSDGIPGVPGIGEKTAARLLSEVESLDALMDAVRLGGTVPGLTPRLAGVLEANAQEVSAMVEVATIRRDAPWAPHEGDERTVEYAPAAKAIAAAWGVERLVLDLLATLERR